MTSPLEGIRVLDRTRLLPGPFCGMLANLGADMLKVDTPRRAAPIRAVDPDGPLDLLRR
ncbi:MAG TPA: CoA transferase [Chloroflexota bacterium]